MRVARTKGEDGGDGVPCGIGSGYILCSPPPACVCRTKGEEGGEGRRGFLVIKKRVAYPWKGSSRDNVPEWEHRRGWGRVHIKRRPFDREWRLESPPIFLESHRHHSSLTTHRSHQRLSRPSLSHPNMSSSTAATTCPDTSSTAVSVGDHCAAVVCFSSVQFTDPNHCGNFFFDVANRTQ
jgi:hypothetical protein